MDIQELEESNALLGDDKAIKERWERDGVLFFRNVIPSELVKRAEGKFRKALADENLIDPAVDKLVWTGVKSDTWRPCDAIGTELWPEYSRLPLLNHLMRVILEDEPVWIPIVGHRSSMPTGEIKPDQDIFHGRHQDSYFSRGMHYIVCWMPVKDAAVDAGSFTVAPGMHKQGHFYNFETHKIIPDAIPDEAWRASDFHAGDLLVFDFFTPHATLPNPSDQIRISIDLRAVAASSALPVIGSVESVDGANVVIRTDDDELIEVHVTDDTYIRDMNPTPRIATADIGKIAYPGAHVMATRTHENEAVIFRRNFY